MSHRIRECNQLILQTSTPITASDTVTNIIHSQLLLKCADILLLLPLLLFSYWDHCIINAS